MFQFYSLVSRIVLSVAISIGCAHVTHAQRVANFNIQNSRIIVSDAEPLRLGGDFTIEAWVYITAYPDGSNQSIIVDKSSASAGYTFAIKSDGKLEFSYNYSLIAPRNRLTSNATVPTFTWTHVAVTWDDTPPPYPIVSQGKLYLNGVLDKAMSFVNLENRPTSNTDMSIGGLAPTFFTTPSAGLRGQMDELKIWDVARSAAEVDADRFDMCYIPASQLLLYYKFDENTNPIANTATGNYPGNTYVVAIVEANQPARPSAFFVDGSVAASGNGTNWGTAFKTLDEALFAANLPCGAFVQSIYVAAGTYKPTRKPYDAAGLEITTANNRDRCFHIRRDNLHLYGGFPNGGGPTANPAANPTILSGDFNGDDAHTGSGAGFALTGNGENAYHVLLSMATNTRVDGFTIRGGNATGLGALTLDGNTVRQYSGGGAYGLAGVTRCVFSHNQASEGGGLHDAGRLTNMTDCTFSANTCGGQGAGVYLAGRPAGTTTLTNVSFTGNNTANAGGGLFCQGTSTRQLTQCIFSQNTAPNGAGLAALNAAQVGLQACVFSGNQASSNGGGLYNLNSVLQLTNTLFIGNSANVHGGGTYSELGSIAFENNTFFANSAILKGGGLYNAGGNGSMTNSLVWNNADDTNHGIFNAIGANLTVAYSLVQGVAIFPGTGNTNGDPRFKTPQNPIGPDNIWRTDDDGLQLDCQSAAYNTGTNAAGGATDIRGNNRNQLGALDMGAYESDRVLLPPTPFITGESVATGYLQKEASGGIVYLWSGGDTPNQSKTLLRTSGTYTVTVTNVEGCTNTASTTVTVYPCPGATLYVDSSIVASGTGNTWATAYKTLDEALLVAWRCPDVNRIEVAKGTYQASRLPYTPEGFPLNVFGAFITFHLRNGVALVGGFPSGGGAQNPSAHPTILTGNRGSVLLSIHDNANTRVEGLAIKFGAATAFPDFLSIEGEPVNRLMGGGLLAVKSAIQVDNCTFSDNLSYRGGGVFHSFGSPRYTRCTFKNNRALKEGGAVYAYGATLDLTNCAIANNQTDSIAGGVHSYTATVSLTNCTVANNADNGIRNFAGNLTVKNSIVWGNAQGIVTELGGNNTVSNSNIQGGHTGTDNVSIPPFFANETDLDGPDNRDRTADDGLRLTDLSMFINFGNPAGSPAQDITGTSRGGTPDAGAYELSNACTGNTPRIFRVKADAGGSNNGSTWNDAYTSLQTALEQACYGDQIWVAGGTYQPSAYPPNCTGCNTPRDHVFFIRNGLQLYGGFNGTENTLADRPSVLAPTLLSGDIGTPNDSTDNCHHVVLGVYNWKTTRLDGFTVRGGLANGFTLRQDTTIDETGSPEIVVVQVPRNISVNALTVDQGKGGGLNLGQSWITLENLTIARNAARYNGGGLWASSGGPTVRQSQFVANTAPSGGGAYLQNTAPDLYKVRFRGNRATFAVNQAENGGGGLVLNNCTGAMSSCFVDGNRGRGVVMDGNATTSLTNNVFTDNGGGLWMFRASPTVSHCTFSESVYFESGIVNPPQPMLYNCVIWSEEGTARMEHGASSDRVSLRNTVVQGGYATGTNIANADPKYFNQYDADGKDDLFGTADDGLAPDASGSAFNWGAVGETMDITGATRTDAPDAGAYETTVRCPANQTPKVVYVKWDATGADNGTSWANAYRSLYDGLASACSGDQIWVAAGTYKPTTGTERRVSFKLRNGIAVYGGFVGTEAALEARDWRANRCILSGNIGDQNLKTDNSLHVFKNIEVNNTAILDGFTIRDGYANLPEDPTGAGMYNRRSDPQILNCTFEANEAAFGAGMGNEAKSSPTVSNCIFDGNLTTIFVGNGTRQGGGMYNKDTSNAQIRHTVFINNNSREGGALCNTKESRPYLANVVFANNYAIAGGAVANIDVAEAYGANCTFYGNSADQGPAVYNYNYGFFTMVNGIFWDNVSEIYNAPAQGLTYEPNFRGSSQSYITHSIVKGGFNGTGNTTQDPLFANATHPPGPDNQLRTADDGLRLLGSSPAVNTGVVPTPSVPTDILGTFRDAEYDRGAYEVFCATTLYVDGNVTTSGDGTAWNKAFKTLDEAMSATCAANTRINIAAGIYKPTQKPVDLSGTRITTADPRDVTFQIPPGVQLFGGYPAGGGIRDIAANPTILSGDLNGNDGVSGCGETLTFTGNGENAYHVVLLMYETPGGRSALLDGLSIKGGNANGAGAVDLSGFPIQRHSGGGIFANYSYATLNQVTIQHNNANAYGGGIRAYAAPLTMTHCAVVENFAAQEGGGVNHYWIHEYDRSTFGQYTKFKMEDTRLECNRSGGGGALFSGNNHPLSVKRTLFRNNYASLFGGAGFLSNGSITTAGTFAETVFEGNETKGLGGGALWVTNVGGHTFENTVFYQNKSKDMGGAGGAAYLEPSSFSNDITRFNNCTFYGNQSKFYGGGITTSGGQIDVLNTVFYQNAGDLGGSDIHNRDNTTALTIGYSSLQLANNGAYNTGAFNSFSATAGVLYGQNPLFTNAPTPPGNDGIWRTEDDGLQLGSGSPLINMGTVPNPPLPMDMLGAARQGAYDIGAYEQTCSPVAFNVGGGGPLCNGGSASIALSGSQIGVSYQLRRNGAPEGLPQTGTGNNLTFSTALAGVYTILATNATSGCTATMHGTATAGGTAAAIVIEETSGAFPNDGILCPGATALLGASGGTAYLWSNGATTASIAVLTGFYGVTATDMNGCQLLASATVTNHEVTTVYSLINNNNGTITLSGSQSGALYQLQSIGFQSGGAPQTVGAPKTGTGGALLFNTDGGGDYTIVATASTGCTALMNGSVHIPPSNLQSGGSGTTVTIVENSGIAPNDGQTCAGASVTISAPDGDGYMWSNGAMGQSITVAPTVTTTYTVTYNGAFATTSTSTTIYVSEQPSLFTDCPTGPISANTADDGCGAIVSYNVAADAGNLVFSLSGATMGGGTGSGSGSVFNKGTTTVTVTALSGCGILATPCAFEVRVFDMRPPTLVCPSGNPVRRDASNVGSYSVQGTELDPTFGDNCSGASIANSLDNKPTLAGYVLPFGPTTVVWTVTDAEGQRASCSLTVAVTAPPAVQCPDGAPFSRNTDLGTCSYFVQGGEFDPSAYTGQSLSNNINNTATLQGASLPKGVAVVTWTATSIAGTTATCSFAINITHNRPPLVSQCPTNQQVNADAGTCAALRALQGPMLSSDCSGALTWGATFSGNPNGHPGEVSGIAGGTASMPMLFQKGITTVTLSATDAMGNALTQACVFTMTIVDDEAPQIVCPSNISTGVDFEQCAAAVSYTTPVGTDNCPGATTLQTSGLTTGASFPVGITVNTFQVSAANGTTATCSFIVNVADDENPKLLECPSDQYIQTDPGNCTAHFSVPSPLANDNCPRALTWEAVFSGNPIGNPSGVMGISIGGTSPSLVFQKGTTAVAISIVDAVGNRAIQPCSFNIVVTDNELPRMACPGNLTNQATAGACTAVVNYLAPSGTDNCSGATTTQIRGLPSGASFPLGTTVNVFQTTDAAGNTHLCSFSVTVLDLYVPVIVCPANIVRNTDLGQCNAVVHYTAPLGTSVCGSSNTLQTAGLSSGAIFPMGITVNVFQVAASNGMTATCSFTVTVNDAQTPTLTCPANRVHNTDLGQCTAAVSFNNPTASDNCGMPTLAWVSGGINPVQGPTNNAVFPKGITTVQWKATDAASLTKTCTFRVLVNDREAPTMTCPPALHLHTAPNTCTAVAVYAAPSFTDNCSPTHGTAVRISGPASGASVEVGNNHVVFQATDAGGNTQRCTLTIAVTDNQLPAISCPDPITTIGGGTPCTAVVFYPIPTASDNCAGTLTPFLVNGLSTGSTFPMGITTNVWRTVAPNGQTAECSFPVTVNCPNGRTVPVLPTPLTSHFNLFPNPANGQVNFEISGLDTLCELRVSDALGRLVMHRFLTADQTTGSFDVSPWASGAYQVQVRTKTGIMVKTLVRGE